MMAFQSQLILFNFIKLHYIYICQLPALNVEASAVSQDYNL